MTRELWTVLAVCAALDDKMFAGVPGHWERKLRLAIRAWKKSVKGSTPTEQNLKITLVLMSHSVVIVAEEQLRNASPNHHHHHQHPSPAVAAAWCRRIFG
ncbi:unnamed protein product, partial [Mesorhabditis spiculigera]